MLKVILFKYLKNKDKKQKRIKFMRVLFKRKVGNQINGGASMEFYQVNTSIYMEARNN